MSAETGSPSAAVRYRRAADVHEKKLGETFFLFTPRGGFYGFDGVGRDMWDLIAAGRTIAEIVERFSTTYDVDAATVRADLADFVQDLRSQGLVEPIEDASQSPLGPEVSRQTT